MLFVPEGSSVDEGNDDGSTPQMRAVEATAEAILQMAIDDEAEKGEWGGSDVEGLEVDNHFDAMMVEVNNDIDVDEWGEISSPLIPGAPDGWIPPGPPTTFLGYVPKLDAPENFSDVDNPDRWSQFVFQPKYGQMNNRGPKVYVGHRTPAGAKVVPLNDDGVREVNGWKFYYQGWEPDDFDKSTYVRGTAAKECLKPADRKGSLDANRLRAHGLSAKRMKSGDPLFFSSCCCPFAIQCVWVWMTMVGCHSLGLVQHTQMGARSGRRTGAEGTVTNTDSRRSRTWFVGWVFQFGMVHEMEAPAVSTGAGWWTMPTTITLLPTI